jgi:hypothetical protein
MIASALNPSCKPGTSVSVILANSFNPSMAVCAAANVIHLVRLSGSFFPVCVNERSVVSSLSRCIRIDVGNVAKMAVKVGCKERNVRWEPAVTALGSKHSHADPLSHIGTYRTLDPVSERLSLITVGSLNAKVTTDAMSSSPHKIYIHQSNCDKVGTTRVPNITEQLPKDNENTS